VGERFALHRARMLACGMNEDEAVDHASFLATRDFGLRAVRQRIEARRKPKEGA
jgi:hypothetical protein